MINFEEELKKFHPSLEVEDAEEAIYNQDLTDAADLLVKMMKEAEEKEEKGIKEKNFTLLKIALSRESISFQIIFVIINYYFSCKNPIQKLK